MTVSSIRSLFLAGGVAVLAVPAASGSRPSPAARGGARLATAREPARAAVRVQRLQPIPVGRSSTLDSEHFEIVYDTRRLSPDGAEEARRVAEAGWARCEKLFGSAPEGKLRLDLTPNFYGATGFAKPGDPKARDADERPMIGVRYSELDYLGLRGDYVLTHEIGHVFSGKVAGSALGEGIADWAAGNFAGIPMRPWWGAALRRAGLWLDPDAFFITGEFEPRPEVDEVIRTAQYVESGLLVQFLVERFGWAKTAAFAAEYGKLRGRLNSNADRKTLKTPRDFQPRPDRPDPRLPPDASALRAVWERHFGLGWDKLRAEWEGRMEGEAPPAGQAERLVLAERIYGAVRNWEMWTLEQKPAPDKETRTLVREAFTRANRALASGDLAEAARAYEQARAMVEQLRRPKSVA
jgi:hypothetical protein